jgi:hypothetical protein
MDLVAEIQLSQLLSQLVVEEEEKMLQGDLPAVLVVVDLTVDLVDQLYLLRMAFHQQLKVKQVPLQDRAVLAVVEQVE